MPASVREVTQSPQFQGTAEQIAYKFNFTIQGTPTGGSCRLKEYKNGILGTALGTTYLSGAVSLSDVFVITPTVLNLVAGETYRLFCMATISTNVYEPYCELIGEE